MSKKMTSAERFDAIEIAIGNLEGVADAVRNIRNEEIPELFRRAKDWELIEHRVSNLEASTGVEGEGTSDVPQVGERLVAIESAQKDLGEAMKDLTQEVKDVVATLRAEMSDIAASVKVLMLAMGNISQEGGASERRGKVKIPEPRPYAGERDAQKLENFVFDMDQYFQAADITSEEAQLNRATMFLTDNAKVWWRTKYQEIQEGKCSINTWEELKQELKEHFYPENVDYLARRKLRDLRQTGSVQDYVKKFTTIMLDIRDMTEKDKLFAFIMGLSREAAIELQRRRVQSLSEAVTAAERLSDYDIGFQGVKSHGGGSQTASASQSGKGGKSKSGGGDKGVPAYSQNSASSQTSNNKGKSKTLACFLCNGPHRVAECPHRAALSALQVIQEEAQEGDKGGNESSDGEDKSCARIGAIRFLEPQE